MKKLLVITGLILLLIGCAAEDDVAFQTYEEQRQTAVANADWNANIYRNTYHKDLKIKSRGDSSIKNGCATGDGWATVDLLTTNGVKAVELKCSTVSSSIACMTTEDFQTRYKDNTCDKELPFPLPKIVQ